jgi:ribosomal protein S18 acetylase RimI-like enzyme
MERITTTYLEMTDRARLRPAGCTDPRFRIVEATVKQWRFNRFLYELVGRDWDWTDKLPWSDDQWRAYVEDERLRTLVAYHGGAVAGYAELQERDHAVEIAYLGLAPEFLGRGFGGALLTRTLEEAWATGPARVWVHTCTLDHPAALRNYQARGMEVYKTETNRRESPTL